ncbi:vitelline membrane outer layer 1-like [Brachionus plicatilis]|uniref:Vitelline membrane outer layer 1-like n=1 Tax=Brachionus plicatilis TaxID=10195 RepID=A0A3M7P2Y5_BRAPC|nr:vitelline membrane outer layer 1-like [Brachionus plicatilis]
MVLNGSCREYSTVIGSDRHTNWGDWHEPVFCPPYSFAVGIDIKFERLQFAGDDTHLNAIRLTCDDVASTKIQSGEGAFGKWFTETSKKRSIGADSSYNNSARLLSIGKYLPKILKAMGKAAKLAQYILEEEPTNGCDDLGKFTGFKFIAEPPISGDDTAGNMVSMFCEGGDQVWFNIQYFGKNLKETRKNCPDEQAICGIRTQIEPKINGDDTALNNVDFYCCKNYYKFFNIATKRVLDSDFNKKVYTLDNNDSPHQRWEIIEHDQKYFSLKNAKTGLILDSNHNGNVYTNPNYGNDYQKWFFDDKNRVVNKATNRALDSNFEGSVYTFPPNDSDHQLWFRR